VTARLQLDLPPGPIRLAAGAERLVLLHTQGLVLFNTSMPTRQPPRLLAGHSLTELWAGYGLQGHAGSGGGSASGRGTPGASHASGGGGDGGASMPLLATGPRGKGLLLGLGGAGFALFTSAPRAGGGGGGGGWQGDAGGDRGVNWMRIAQPFVVVLMVVVGFWQYNRASQAGGKRHRLMGGRGEDALFDMGLGSGRLDMGDVGGMLGMGRQARSAAGLGGRRRAAAGGGGGGGGRPRMSEAEFRERLARIDAQMKGLGGRGGGGGGPGAGRGSERLQRIDEADHAVDPEEEPAASLEALLAQGAAHSSSSSMAAAGHEEEAWSSGPETEESAGVGGPLTAGLGRDEM
jgi:hypothetical protein